MDARDLHGGLATLGTLALGATAGAAFGAAVHPGPQYMTPLSEQMARSAAFGALAAAVLIGTMYVGVRMRAIPTA